MRRARITWLVAAAAGLGLLFATSAGAEGVTLSLPPDLTVEATSASGATVSFDATATNGGGKALSVACDPASGSVFPLGETTVTCTVLNDQGATQGEFAITVVDTSPPSLSAHPDLIAEATSAGGAEVDYVSPTATDTVDGALPVVCVPASGLVLPLGSTTVVCYAEDTHGNVGSVSFAAVVRDTTPPVLTVPSPAVVSEGNTSGIAAFLHGATATDLVDPSPMIFNNAPASLSPKTWTITFTAIDKSGNATSATSFLKVVPKVGSSVGPSTGPGAPDRVPPGDVSRLTAKAGNGVVLLSWRVPTDADFDHVVVTRSSPVGRDSVVYTGKGTTYQDRPLLNGVRYRYVIVSYDVTGNASGGVGLSALPRTLALLAPRAGATVRAGSRPLLLWRKVRHATYYNVQLYRGAEKVFTAWPSSARLRVSREWRYAGRRQTLSAGVYRWYVWPGFGARSQRRYGTMLGQSGFTVVAQSGPVAKPGG